MKRLVFIFVASITALVGCGQKSAVDAGVACQGSPIAPGSDVDVPPFQSNMQALSADGMVQVVLMESNPTPPPVQVATTWTVQLNDASGQALPSATLSVPPPYMPFHGHYSDQTPCVGQIVNDACQAQAGNNGQFTVSNLYFFMPGVWQVTMQVTNGGNVEDVLFHLCLD